MTHPLYKTPQSVWRIFLWPLVINCICLLGLISALIGNGWLDLFSWICLGGPVVLMAYASFHIVESSNDY